jgi:hypothetical protein
MPNDFLGSFGSNSFSEHPARTAAKNMTLKDNLWRSIKALQIIDEFLTVRVTHAFAICQQGAAVVKNPANPCRSIHSKRVFIACARMDDFFSLLTIRFYNY